MVITLQDMWFYPSTIPTNSTMYYDDVDGFLAITSKDMYEYVPQVPSDLYCARLKPCDQQNIIRINLFSHEYLLLMPNGLFDSISK